jgi:hypothetical protein
MTEHRPWRRVTLALLACATAASAFAADALGADTVFDRLNATPHQPLDMAALGAALGVAPGMIWAGRPVGLAQRLSRDLQSGARVSIDLRRVNMLDGHFRFSEQGKDTGLRVHIRDLRPGMGMVVRCKIIHKKVSVTWVGGQGNDARSPVGLVDATPPHEFLHVYLHASNHKKSGRLDRTFEIDPVYNGGNGQLRAVGSDLCVAFEYELPRNTSGEKA